MSNHRHRIHRHPLLPPSGCLVRSSSEDLGGVELILPEDDDQRDEVEACSDPALHRLLRVLLLDSAEYRGETIRNGSYG